MRGAASPISPSSTRARSRASCAPLMGNRIYGCDDCLAVCPWNKFAQAGREAKLAARDALRAPTLAELARLDDAAFRALFAKIAGQAHRPRPLRAQCADRDRQFGRCDARAAKPSGCSTMPRRWCAAPPCGRCGGSIRARLAALRREALRAPRPIRRRREWTAAWTDRGRDGHACSASALAIRRSISSRDIRRRVRAHRRHGARRARRPRRSRRAHLAGTRSRRFVFDGTAANAGRDRRADRPRRSAVLVSVPPGENGDPVLAHFADTHRGRAAPATRSSICRPSASMAIMAAHGSTRRRRRAGLGAQPRAARCRAGVAALGARAGKPVAILRLAGNLRARPECAGASRARQRAKRIVKPGQVFNRIHVADIAQAIDAAFARKCRRRVQCHRRRADAAGRIRSPSPRELLGVAPPPEIPFAEAAKTMSPMALSFYRREQARAERQAQARAWRQLALSDLSRRIARAVRKRRRSRTAMNRR